MLNSEKEFECFAFVFVVDRITFFSFLFYLDKKLSNSMDAEKVQIQKKQEKQDQKSMEFIKQNVKQQQQQSSKTTSKNNENVKKNIDSKSKPKSDNKNSLFTCQHDKLIGLEMKKFIQNIFIDNIESIINQWLPEIIIELDNFI